LPEKSIIRDSQKSTILSIYPATTATVFNSVCTGEYPAVHGICGWALRKNNELIDVLPWRNQLNGDEPEKYGVNSLDIFKMKSIFQFIDRPYKIFNGFKDTPFMHYFVGKDFDMHYEFCNPSDLNDAVNKIPGYLKKVEETENE